MKTTMAQNQQELASNLAQFSHLALTDKEMVKLFGGTSTSGSSGNTTTETKPTTTTTKPGNDAKKTKLKFNIIMRTTDYLIEKYLDSTLTEVEGRMLNERMVGDSTLQRELMLRHEINQMAIEEEVYMLRAKLNMASAFVEENQQNRFVNHKTKRVFYAAATIAGIAMGGWAISTGWGQKQNYDDIYRSSFVPYPPVTVFRQGSNVASDDDFFSTMSFYQNSHFAEAAAGLEKLLQMDPNSATVKFYLAISYMELEKFNDSHRLFDEIIGGDSFFVEQATWYKGLIFIAQGKTDLACNTLAKLAAYENPYTIKSKSLVKKLKQE